ncbi:MAG: hypothetical protein JWQ81_5915 [Amycolatopsis sp.]|nr:hypothetical protein [Amycolatopsis sp.]
MSNIPTDPAERELFGIRSIVRDVLREELAEVQGLPGTDLDHIVNSIVEGLVAADLLKLKHGPDPHAHVNMSQRPKPVL